MLIVGMFTDVVLLLNLKTLVAYQFIGMLLVAWRMGENDKAFGTLQTFYIVLNIIKDGLSFEGRAKSIERKEDRWEQHDLMHKGSHKRAHVAIWCFFEFRTDWPHALVEE